MARKPVEIVGKGAGRHTLISALAAIVAAGFKAMPTPKRPGDDANPFRGATRGDGHRSTFRFRAKPDHRSSRLKASRRAKQRRLGG